MWGARDTDVAVTMPPGHWLVTVASTSGCGRFAVVSARCSKATPFGSPAVGATPCLSSLGLRVLDVQSPPQGPAQALHPALAAVVAGDSALVMRDQRRAARDAFERGTMRLDPLRSLEDAKLPEDCYAVLEAASVDWATGEVSPPPVSRTGTPGRATGYSSRGSSPVPAEHRGRAREARTPEQLVRDGAVFSREAIHCCSLIAFPKLQRSVVPDTAAQDSPGKPPRVQIQGPGLESRLSAVPEDMVMRSTHRFDLGQDDLARLVGCVAGADRAVAAVHKQLCERRIGALQRRLDAKRLALAQQEAESMSARV
jgi:hypothetical protein